MINKTLFDLLGIVIDILNLAEQLTIYVLILENNLDDIKDIIFFGTLFGIGLCSLLISRVITNDKIQIILFIFLEIGELLLYIFVLKRTTTVIITTVCYFSIEFLLYIFRLCIIIRVERKSRLKVIVLNDYLDKIPFRDREKFKTDLYEYLQRQNFHVSLNSFGTMLSDQNNDQSLKDEISVFETRFISSRKPKCGDKFLIKLFKAAVKYSVINSFQVSALCLSSNSAFRATYCEILTTLNFFITVSTLDVDNIGAACYNQPVHYEIVPKLMDTMSSLATSLSKRSINTLFCEMKNKYPIYRNATKVYIIWQVILHTIASFLTPAIIISSFILAIIDLKNDDLPKTDLIFYIFVLIYSSFGILFIFCLIIGFVVASIIDTHKSRTKIMPFNNKF